MLSNIVIKIFKLPIVCSVSLGHEKIHLALIDKELLLKESFQYNFITD